MVGLVSHWLLTPCTLTGEIWRNHMPLGMLIVSIWHRYVWWPGSAGQGVL